MNEYELRISETAERDLDAIADYIALGLREPAIALKQIERIRVAVLSLWVMPERYGLVVDGYLASKGIHKLPVDRYLVFYTVDKTENVVNILRVLYGKREWEALL